MPKQKTEIDIENELRVKSILDERKILMKDFAMQIGITRETLTRSLKGNPQYSTLKAIADGLNLTVPDLFISKPQAENSINGYIEIDGEIHKVSSKEDILNLARLLNEEQSN